MGFKNPLNLPPGAITGSMLAADAINGKTITGAKIRTAAPPALRWELTSDAVNLLRAYSGTAQETSPGGVDVGTGGSPWSVSLVSPATNNVAPAAVRARVTDAGGSSEVSIESYNGGGELVDLANAANTISWFRGDLNVPGRVNVKDGIWSGAFSGTTDASGFLTVTHAAGFTPSGGWAINTTPNSSFAEVWGIDSLTATTVRLRFANVASTGALASAAVSGRLFLVHP